MLAKRLKELRRSAGLTQRTLAENLHISKCTYGLYETGHSAPNADMLIIIAKFFGCSSDYLLGLSSIRTTGLSLSDTEHELERKLRERDKQLEEVTALANKLADICLAPSGRHSA